MTQADWHVDGRLLHRYAAGGLAPSAEWAIEAHVADCAVCREQAGEVASELHPVAVTASWDEVDRRVMTYGADRARVLRVLGVPADVRRVLTATPTLTLAWVVAVVAALGAVVAATHLLPSPVGEGPVGLVWFLLAAPVLPVSGIVVAFGATSDPVGEIALAAPVASGRLLLVRTVAVVAVALPLTAVASMFVPAAGWDVVAWLAPTLAVTTTAVALVAVTTPGRAVVMAQLGWVVPVAVVAAAGRQLIATQFAVQVAATVIATVAAGVAVLARDRYEVSA